MGPCAASASRPSSPAATSAALVNAVLPGLSHKLDKMLLIAALAASMAIIMTPSGASRHRAATSRHRVENILADSSALTVLGGTLARVAEERPPGRTWLRMGTSWVCPPPTTPWAAVHFVGGAGFGSAPQLAYDALLSRIASRCGVVVIATPFDVGFDHFGLAAATHAAFDSAREACEEQLGLATTAPTFRLGHRFASQPPPAPDML